MERHTLDKASYGLVFPQSQSDARLQVSVKEHRRFSGYWILRDREFRLTASGAPGVQCRVARVKLY